MVQVDVLLDDALEALVRFDPRKARVVELRFFGGLSVEETAEVLNISSITVMRDWSTARAWLYREMSRISDEPATASLRKPYEAPDSGLHS
jgi:RNA polymerase sigma factor (sigma-70 family)